MKRKLIAVFGKTRNKVQSALWALYVASGYHPELYYMRGPGPKWKAKHRT
jgi:hypothetical protein